MRANDAHTATSNCKVRGRLGLHQSGVVSGNGGPVRRDPTQSGRRPPIYVGMGICMDLEHNVVRLLSGLITIS